MSLGPWALRTFNSTARAFGALRARDVLVAEKLIAEARKRTGLTDFGDDAWREPFAVLLRGVVEEAHLSPFGVMVVRDDFTQRLCNLLQIEDAIRKDPGILDESLGAPIFVLGLPRTGTTHLHRLLACDPSARAPRTWEMSYPVPPPEEATYETDPRIAVNLRSARVLNFANPTLRTIHDLDARQPEECITLMANDFMSIWFLVSARLDEYMAYYDRVDLVPAYRRHALQLRVLQRKFRRDRWVLKAPSHMHGLEALLTVYPDAKIVWTHRDPASVMASVASLMYQFRRTLSDDVDREQVGAQVLEQIGTWWDRGWDARERATRDGTRATFVDIDYADLVKAPIATVERIYAGLGVPFSPAARDAMNAHLQRAVKDKFGSHKYTLAEFGLSADKVASRIRPRRPA